MVTSATQNIIDSWDYLCYYKRVKRNKTTNAEAVIASGRYTPVYSGIVRVGEKVSILDSTYDLVEYTVLVLKPDLSRLYIGTSAPTIVSMRVYFSTFVLNTGETSSPVTLKLWANSSFLNWTSATSASYNSIVNYYIPFDLTSSTYSSSIYEREVTVTGSGTSALFETLRIPFYSFMKNNSIGFAITGRNAYADVFNSDYNLSNLRPIISISQTIPYRSSYYFYTDVEITGRSHIIGVCRDRNGVIVTGSQTEIAVYDLNQKDLIGSGLSDLNGAFRIKTECKTNEQILVTFVNEDNGINGCEIMTAFGSSSSSSSSLSSSSSSSSLSSSSSSSSLSSSSSSNSSSSSSSSLSSSSSSSSLSYSSSSSSSSG